ncbi:hypothetical protein KCP75_22830 [Salmonella enterica subsp. enterica]|nr:hypothetical protein KCP75_22830 [Salmonella enterica subsp. enterica]
MACDMCGLCSGHVTGVGLITAGRPGAIMMSCVLRRIGRCGATLAAHRRGLYLPDVARATRYHL